MENTEAIRHALQDFRRQALTRFMSEFIPLLQQEGYTVEDLLNALTDLLTTKYRKKVITPAMLTRLTELIQHISQKWGCEVIEFNGEADHVHLLFRYYPQMQLSKFVNALKSYTSQIRAQRIFSILETSLLG